MSIKSQPRYTRNSNIINRKFYQFLIPTILSTVAISLNEFVDSIVVAQLLGSDAMSMVGMGSPIMLRTEPSSCTENTGSLDSF